jgi:hypothetical protein
MTAQFSERLRYHDRDVGMCNQPLGVYFSLTGTCPEFEITCTALWRGYVGSWDIVDDRLYLIKINGSYKDGSPVTLASLFPEFPERVFAHWYSGELRIPEGKLLDYVHQGYGSTYERDIFLQVENGVVIFSRTVHNGTSLNVDAPEGYAVGGMTIFGKDIDQKPKS